MSRQNHSISSILALQLKANHLGLIMLLLLAACVVCVPGVEANVNAHAGKTHLFPPLEPYLGGYTLKELYDLDTQIPADPPEKDIPASVMAAVDPRSIPYPVILEEDWLEAFKPKSADYLIAESKKGNVVAMVSLLEWSLIASPKDPFWAKLADSLTHPGWAFGLSKVGPAERGAYLGDGRAIHAWRNVRALNRLSGLAGYPEGMAEGGAYLDSAGFCRAAREWSLEAAMRGYAYAWDYAGYNYRKGCPKEGLVPDIATSWAAFHIECEYTNFSSITGACGISKAMLEEMTETGREQARLREDELLRQTQRAKAARLEEQRARISRKLPDVVAAINAHLDECIAKCRHGDVKKFYGLTVEQLQKLRDQSFSPAWNETPPAEALRLFPPLEPHLGGYTMDELYDPAVIIPSMPPQQEVPLSVIAAIDPTSTPYPIILEKEWLKASTEDMSVPDLIAQAQKGNIVAMAALQEKTFGSTFFWARLADSLAHPGWTFGYSRKHPERGARLGDGEAILQWSMRNATMDKEKLYHLSGLAGQPDSMYMTSDNLYKAGFCAATRAWSLEAAMRGSDTWPLVAHSYIKACPNEGLPSDIATAWAVAHLQCKEKKDLYWCAAMEKGVEEMTEFQRLEAEARAEDLRRLRDETLAAKLEKQRERIRRKLPEVAAAIKAHLDACIEECLRDKYKKFYGLTGEQLQRLRDL